MSRIRMIVSDLDGTLLSENHILTDSVKDAIKHFRSLGGLFTIATGRFGPSAMHIVEELDIDIPFILCNGSVLADQNKILVAATLTLKELVPFLLEVDRQGMTVMQFKENSVCAFRRSSDVKYFEEKEGIEIDLIDPLSNAWREEGFLVQKASVLGNMQRIKDIWNNQPTSLRSNYTVVQSEDDCFEIIPPNQSKGKALRKLMSLMKVSPSEVMGIGNQLNDMELLKYAGVGVAVANSHPELKSQATYVCNESYGEGVIEAMERFAYIPILSRGVEKR